MKFRFFNLMFLPFFLFPFPSSPFIYQGEKEGSRMEGGTGTKSVEGRIEKRKRR